MPKVRIRAGTREENITAETGERLLDVLRRAGVNVAAPCGGLGRCGKCRATVNGEEVLACRYTVTGDAEITVRELTGGAILGGETASAHGGKRLGAALDLGTTTLALRLYDLDTGKCTGQRTAWNAQAAYGADVITRAQYCMEHPEGTETLQRVVGRQLDEMLGALGTSSENIESLLVAGNTIMQHLFEGLDPSPIAVAPFTPRTLFEDCAQNSCHSERSEESLPDCMNDRKDASPGLRMTETTYSPCVAGYVGGDITAGLLASGLFEKDGRHLFLDVGTNGEMALGGKDGFVCCAVASGPAFEGAGIACGMAGVVGAVSHVRFESGALRFDVIGGGEAKGLCGSGLVDLAALLCREGIITASGLLLPPEEAPENWAEYLREDEDGNGIFSLTPSVYLSARDVRQLQLAKAAVAAGIRVLLKKSGTKMEEIGGLYLAGGFGSFLDPKSAADIGMLPRELADKTTVLGNASLEGAGMALTDKGARARLRDVQHACRYIELSGDRDFNEEYPEQMFFYEEDEEWN